MAGELYEAPLTKNSRKVTAQELEERLNKAEQSVQAIRKRSVVAQGSGGAEAVDDDVIVLESESEDDQAVASSSKAKSAKGSAAPQVGDRQSKAASKRKEEARVQKEQRSSVHTCSQGVHNDQFKGVDAAVTALSNAEHAAKFPENVVTSILTA